MVLAGIMDPIQVSNDRIGFAPLETRPLGSSFPILEVYQNERFFALSNLWTGSAASGYHFLRNQDDFALKTEVYQMLCQFLEPKKLILDILIIMEINSKIVIRPIEPLDREWTIDLISERWRSTLIVTRGVKHEIESLPGFIAYLSGDRVGLLTYSITNAECEIITLDSLMENKGIGSKLIVAAREIAIKSSCNRLWLITTNDNISGLRFYQKRGFHLVAVHKNALEISRRLKPEIPMIGLDGIPLRDEIELEMRITH